MTKSLSFLFGFTLLAFLCGCNKQPEYPKEYVMADSAFMQGNYGLGDALIETIRKTYSPINEKEENYFCLLTLEQAFVHRKLADSLFSSANNLCEYYEGGDEGELYAKALLFTGTLYYQNKNYPAAIEYYLQAKEISEPTQNTHLLCLINRSIGKLFLEQGRFDESIPYYRKYYELAKANCDTLRIAYASDDMGAVNTILNNIDSTIYYYKQAINLADNLPQRELIVPYAITNLCDIYIQTEQFDKALEVMPRDELNDANWAYWHYGQNNMDSAIYYFNKTLGRYKWQGEVEVLQLLAQLERDRGNLNASLDYYERLTEAEDSLKIQQKREETQRIEAQYNYTKIKEQRDKLEKTNKAQSRKIKRQLFVLGVLIFAMILAWFWYRLKRKANLARQELLQNQLDEQKERSWKQMEKNEKELNALRQQLLEARTQQNGIAEERLASEVNVLTSQNQSIEARQRHQQVLKEELYATPLYERLKSTNPKTDKKMSESDWEELRRHIDAIYDGFTDRLLRLAKLSETELRICYLLKIDMPPAEIADILYKSKAAITMARRRMLYKLSMRKGRAEEFDEIISQL